MSKALPKYVQTAELLIREIAAGRLADGSRLPPEREMAADLGIAVGTLRKALDDLEQRGLLTRRQGSGNYVRHRPDAAGVYAFFRLERIAGGGLPTADVLDVALVQKSDALPPFGRSDRAHRIRRLRRLDGDPVAVEEIWLDGVWAETLRPRDLSDSLYLFYRRRLRLWITSAVDVVAVGRVPAWAPEGGSPAAGATAGLVERRSYTATGEIAEFSRSWFDPSKARYVNRIG